MRPARRPGLRVAAAPPPPGTLPGSGAPPLPLVAAYHFGRYRLLHHQAEGMRQCASQPEVLPSGCVIDPNPPEPRTTPRATTAAFLNLSSALVQPWASWLARHQALSTCTTAAAVPHTNPRWCTMPCSLAAPAFICTSGQAAEGPSMGQGTFIK